MRCSYESSIANDGKADADFERSRVFSPKGLIADSIAHVASHESMLFFPHDETEPALLGTFRKHLWTDKIFKFGSVISAQAKKTYVLTKD